MQIHDRHRDYFIFKYMAQICFITDMTYFLNMTWKIIAVIK